MRITNANAINAPAKLTRQSFGKFWENFGKFRPLLERRALNSQMASLDECIFPYIVLHSISGT